jgi:hypothetical protein
MYSMMRCCAVVHLSVYTNNGYTSTTVFERVIQIERVTEQVTWMAKRGRKPQAISLAIGSDPTRWKYASLEEALRCNVHLLAALIGDIDRPQPLESGLDRKQDNDRAMLECEICPATAETAPADAAFEIEPPADAPPSAASSDFSGKRRERTCCRPNNPPSASLG